MVEGEAANDSWHNFSAFASTPPLITSLSSFCHFAPPPLPILSSVTVNSQAPPRTNAAAFYAKAGTVGQNANNTFCCEEDDATCNSGADLFNKSQLNCLYWASGMVEYPAPTNTELVLTSRATISTETVSYCVQTAPVGVCLQVHHVDDLQNAPRQRVLHILGRGGGVDSKCLAPAIKWGGNGQRHTSM